MEEKQQLFNNRSYQLTLMTNWKIEYHKAVERIYEIDLSDFLEGDSLLWCRVDKQYLQKFYDEDNSREMIYDDIGDALFEYVDNSDECHIDTKED